jgi:L-fuconolactonase
VDIAGASVEVVDAQVHANQISPSWRTADLTHAVECAVAAMDAVGIDAMIADEYTGVDAANHVLPGHLAPDGIWHFDQRFVREAVRLYPGRFGYVARVEPRDPELAAFMAGFFDLPNQLALRLTNPGSQIERIRAGYYDPIFALADKHRVPICINVSQEPEVVGPVLEAHPGLTLILDHCGIAFSLGDRRPPDYDQRVERLVKLARYENLAIKWCHVERLSFLGYPFADALATLRNVLDAYGAERVMWGSDATESRNPERSERPCTWAEALYSIRDSTIISTEEKKALLGGSLRRILRWDP